MRTLLLLFVLLLPFQARAQITGTLTVYCLPLSFVEAFTTGNALQDRTIGRFDDGDALIIFKNALGRFLLGYVSSEGLFCVLGSGTELKELPQGKAL